MSLKLSKQDFPGGPVVKNPPSNAGDVGSILGQGTKIPHALEQLRPDAAPPPKKKPLRKVSKQVVSFFKKLLEGLSEVIYHKLLKLVYGYHRSVNSKKVGTLFLTITSQELHCQYSSH